mmetsp:Transcript_56091/g.128782  ORF Transcript_56091/g.128782 Transcript_56091/m.128782 type:complete len:234 (+) Transcript_56091:536-1237(+)
MDAHLWIPVHRTLSKLRGLSRPGSRLWCRRGRLRGGFRRIEPPPPRASGEPRPASSHRCNGARYATGGLVRGPWVPAARGGGVAGCGGGDDGGQAGPRTRGGGSWRPAAGGRRAALLRCPVGGGAAPHARGNSVTGGTRLSRAGFHGIIPSHLQHFFRSCDQMLVCRTTHLQLLLAERSSPRHNPKVKRRGDPQRCPPRPPAQQDACQMAADLQDQQCHHAANRRARHYGDDV